MTQEIPPDTESRARSLFGDLIEGRLEKARREFDGGVRHADADQIARGSTIATRPGGSFKGMAIPGREPVRRLHRGERPAGLPGR